MTNFILLVIIGIILFLAIRYIVKAKKSGVKCIGCSSGNKKNCSHSCKSDIHK